MPFLCPAVFARQICFGLMKKIKFIINAITPKIAILILASILIFLAAESIG
jgi:hypothetical protein